METTILNEKTRVFKSFRDNEWNAETTQTIDGVTWEIRTSKRYNGTLGTTAQECKKSAGEVFNCTVFSPFQDKNITLISEKVRCTEKAVREQHYKALTIFEQKQQSGELPKVEPEQVLKVGQIVWLNGYGQDKYNHKRQAVYQIDGSMVRTVDLDNFTRSNHDHVRHDSKIFGIGIYWTTGDTADSETIANALIEATRKEQEAARQKEAAAILANAQRLAELEEGAKIVQVIPAWAKMMIIGRLMQDDSDPMTDYFSSHVEKVVYLGFSSHNKDLFSEMRKAAANCPDTANFANIPTVDTNGEEKNAENAQWWTPEDEHREKYSMGAGYYLGAKYSRSGWQVCKASLPTLETLQIAAAQGRYFVPANDPQPEQGATEKTVTINEAKNGIEIHFPGKPSPETLTALKSNGWRWSGFNKVWYNRNNPDNLTFANGL